MMDFDHAWHEALHDTLRFGQLVAPRGLATKELPQRTLTVSMRQPVLRTAARKLNYRFMAAEAYWILSGDDRVATIVPYNERLAAFSDDGERFFGAYGPKIVAQLPYVVAKLTADPLSRQAGLTTWRESPPATKDVPCTVAMFFSIRGQLLHSHVFMRSSDLWLGVPYDIFNFSMLGHLVCCLLNKTRELDSLVSPGTLHLTAASSHLYETNWEAAWACVESPWAGQTVTPQGLWVGDKHLMATLLGLRDAKPGDELRWWEAS